MNALFLDSDNHLSWKSVEKPSLTRDTDVLIAVVYAGLCGTDLHIIEGKLPSAKNIVIGHEFVGTVAQKGEGVTRLALGDKVGTVRIQLRIMRKENLELLRK